MKAAPRALQTWTRRHPDGRVDTMQWVDVLERPGEPVPELDREALERAYFAWLPRLCGGLVSARIAEQDLDVAILQLPMLRLLRLGQARDQPWGRERAILGGWLGSPGGSLSFEERPFPHGVRLIVAVRGLSPRMPYWFYRRVQLRLHERISFSFLREWLAQLGKVARIQRSGSSDLTGGGGGVSSFHEEPYGASEVL